MTRGRPNPLHYRLAERLKQARRAVAETRKGVSLAAGAGKTAVHSIEVEGHTPAADQIEGIARAMGVSPGWLAYGMGEPGDVQDVPGAASVSERLRAAREEARISQSELGRRAGMTHTTIQNIEQGRHCPSVARVEALADALDLSPAWLAFGEGPQKVKRRRARPPSP